jgi:hypothetical protein
MLEGKEEPVVQKDDIPRFLDDLRERVTKLKEFL